MNLNQKRDDRRVRNTKQAIQRVFLELLTTTPIHKITVSELCERADINRSTFYMHYHDIYALLELLKQDLLCRIDQLSLNLRSRRYDHYTTMRLILDVIYENRILLKYLILLQPDTAFIKTVKQKTQEVFHHNAIEKRSLSASEKNELEQTLIFLANGFYAMYADWLSRDCSTNIDDFAHLGTRLTQNCLDSLYSTTHTTRSFR